ncbi:MAG: DUF177 domain-containing protein [Rhodobacteraceae bacterium]|nr:DUF177 domain-containing protein [Paracoccaceae bacterium]
MPDETADHPTFSHPLRSASLATRKPTRFDLRPDRATRQWIAVQLGLVDLPAFRFTGEIRPDGRNDFTLDATMTAEAVQPCSVTLAPVIARLTEQVRRRYIADWQEPDGDEVEMPEDDTQDPLPEIIDPALVAMEALELALPLYPRADGVELGEAVFAAPGTAPLKDEDLRPFAGLAALKSRLDGSEPG